MLAAADELLESGGPEAVTLRAVGERAGVSRSAPYRHFSSKADLLTALALGTLAELGSRIRTGGGEDAAGSRLRGGCLGYLDWALEHPQHYLLVFGAAPMIDPPTAIEAAADDGLRALQELIGLTGDTGKQDDASPRERATALWALLHGLVHLQIGGHLHEPRTLDGDTRLTELVDLALWSWGVRVTAQAVAPEATGPNGRRGVRGIR
ncbi:TetR family transcriptional regulator [Rathayibacter tritici]|uniref:TetR family transcriptional regulator n=1 Tax=Rathayibacter tritici TaxID=33888 RepID=A0A160KPQ3_9MICO|nr:TetR family transcriptional regulator [Rathayibacter tritici]